MKVLARFYLIHAIQNEVSRVAALMHTNDIELMAKAKYSIALWFLSSSRLSQPNDGKTDTIYQVKHTFSLLLVSPTMLSPKHEPSRELSEFRIEPVEKENQPILLHWVEYILLNVFPRFTSIFL